jgi:hypothetical protein
MLYLPVFFKSDKSISLKEEEEEEEEEEMVDYPAQLRF